MKDYERTQLSYVAQALVGAPVDQWSSILDDAELGSDASQEFCAAIRAIRSATQKHDELKCVVEWLLKSDSAPVVTAGRTIAWSFEQTGSQTSVPRSGN